MAMFVHLAPERRVKRIRRQGLAGRRLRWVGRRGVFAHPVVPDFQLTHQWIRELKRWAKGSLVAIYFRLPGQQEVLAGHYNYPHARLTADEAVGKLMTSAELGFEVVVPRRIRAAEIVRVAAVPQLVGWRVFPEAKGRPPSICLHCERGWYGVRRMVRAADAAARRNKPTKVQVFGR